LFHKEKITSNLTGKGEIHELKASRQTNQERSRGMGRLRRTRYSKADRQSDSLPLAGIF